MNKTEHEDNIISDYLNWMSTKEISIKYGVHRMTVQRCLTRNSITLRRITHRTKVNHFSFSSYTSDSVYWAGFILADGYIRSERRNTLHIKLAIKDYDHLLKIKKFLGYEGKINKDKNNTCCYIDVSSEKIIKDLELNFNITTRKTFTANIYENIPHELMPHLIRGYFDGDGTLTNKSCPSVGLLGTKETLEVIRSYFLAEGVKMRRKSNNVPKINTVGGICSLWYSGKAARQVCDIMYNNSTTHLDRKFNRYNTYFCPVH